MQSVVVFLLAALSLVSASPYGAWSGYPYPYYYGAPLASPVVLPSGYLADTPEVTHAKATHSTRLATAAAAAAAAPEYPVPVVTPHGFLADTPEVAAAKARHFAEHARARSGYVPHVYAAGYEGRYVPDNNGW